MASDEVNIAISAKLTNAVGAEKMISEDWDINFIIKLYKGKDDALERGNYRGL